MKKQRQESVDLYKKGGRQELLQAEEEEIKIIDSYLPKQLGEEETQKICKCNKMWNRTHVQNSFLLLFSVRVFKILQLYFPAAVIFI